MPRNGAAARKAVPAAKRETIETVEIPVPVTAEQLAKFSREFAAKSIEVDGHVDEKREFLSDWREAHEDLKAEHDRLRAIVNDKAAPKMTKCIVVKDFDRGVVKYLDPKNREVLHQRDLDPEDDQLSIEGTEPARTGGNHVTDRPPAGEAGKKLVGQTKTGDLDAPTPEAGGWP